MKTLTRLMLSSLMTSALILSSACSDKDTPSDDTGLSTGTVDNDSGTGADDGTDSATDPVGDYAFSVAGPASVAAGQDAVFVVTLTEGGADVSGDATITVAADSTDAVVDGLAVSSKLPGALTVTVEATIDGEVFSEDLALEIVPGEPVSLTLDIGPGSVEAGTVVTPSVIVLDDCGNTIDAEVELSASPDGLEILGGDINTSLVGVYFVTAQVVDTAIFQTGSLEVVAGAAADLDLVLEAFSAEVGGSLDAAVTVVDAYGNPVGSAEDLVWTADPPDGVVFGVDSVGFEEEGLFEITVEMDGLSDTEGPVTVDSNGPVIVVDSPSRGDYLTEAFVTFTGSVTDGVTGVASATIDGDSLPLNADGSFSSDVRMLNGVTFVEIVAVDNDGNSSDLLMSVMNDGAGEYLPDGYTIDDMIDAYISEDGLTGLADLTATALDLDAIEDGLMAANPIASSDFSTICFGFGDAYLNIDIDGLDYSDFSVGMRGATDKLVVDVTINDLIIYLDGNYALCGGESTLDSELTADSADMRIQLDVQVTDRGRVNVSVIETAVTLDNFEADFTSLNTLVDVLETLGLDLETIIEDILIEELQTAVEADVPPMVESILEDFAIEQSIDLITASATMEAGLSGITISSDGMELTMTGTVTPDSTNPDIPEVPGFVSGITAHPNFTGSSELELALSLDTINAILHAAWQAGAFSLTLDEDDVGLDSTTISALFPGATSLSMEVLPQMAPVLTDGTGVGMFDIRIGEMQIEAYGEVDGVDTFLADLSVAAVGEVDIEIAGDELAMVTNDLIATFDVHVTDASDVAFAEQVEGILDTFAGSLAADLVPEVAFAIPDISGISLVPDAVSPTGIGNDWIGVEMSIE